MISPKHIGTPDKRPDKDCDAIKEGILPGTDTGNAPFVLYINVSSIKARVSAFS